MSSSEDRGIKPFDWFNRFFGSGGGSSRRSGRGGGGFLVSLIFSEDLMK
jgi:hypothetical protein